MHGKIGIKHFSIHLISLKILRVNQYKTCFESFQSAETFRKKEDKTYDEPFYCIQNGVTHHMFYFLFFETLKRTEMTRKVFYINFHEIFERNQMYRKMFYIFFFMHVKISLTSKMLKMKYPCIFEKNRF